MKRVIQKKLQNELAKYLLSGDIKDCQTVAVDVDKGGEFTFTTGLARLEQAS